MNEIEKAIAHYAEIYNGNTSYPYSDKEKLAREQNEPCEWRQEDEDGSHYSASCGYEFEFTEDGPNSNDFVYCPKCGKPINEIQWGVG